MEPLWNRMNYLLFYYKILNNKMVEINIKLLIVPTLMFIILCSILCIYILFGFSFSILKPFVECLIYVLYAITVLYMHLLAKCFLRIKSSARLNDKNYDIYICMYITISYTCVGVHIQKPATTAMRDRTFLKIFSLKSCSARKLFR